MSKALKLTVAIFVPTQGKAQSVSVGSRALVSGRYIEREVRSWKRIPESIELKPRKRTNGTLSY